MWTEASLGKTAEGRVLDRVSEAARELSRERALQGIGLGSGGAAGGNNSRAFCH